MKNKVTAYKGFDLDWKCKNFQYAVGQAFAHNGDVKMFESVSYVCENPLDVLRYYSPANSRFAIVKTGGEISRKNRGDCKIAIGEIIEREISLPELIDCGVNWLLTGIDRPNVQTSTDNFSVAANMSDYSIATSTGDRSVAVNIGDQSAAVSDGNGSVAVNIGNHSVATVKSRRSVAISMGDRSVTINKGYRSAAISVGYRAVSINTGNRSSAINIADESATINTGYLSAATNIGDYSSATSTGEVSMAAVTGRLSSVEVSGMDSVACALGECSKAKAGAGGAIVCVYRDDDGKLIHIRSAKVGKEGILPDTWYTLDADGNFIQV